MRPKRQWTVRELDAMIASGGAWCMACGVEAPRLEAEAQRDVLPLSGSMDRSAICAACGEPQVFSAEELVMLGEMLADRNASTPDADRAARMTWSEPGCLILKLPDHC